jgi:hypothetical protein
MYDIDYSPYLHYSTLGEKGELTVYSRQLTVGEKGWGKLSKALGLDNELHRDYHAGVICPVLEEVNNG